MKVKAIQVEGTALAKSQKFWSVACVQRLWEFIQESTEQTWGYFMNNLNLN